MRIIKIKNIKIGEGKPKICVPMISDNLEKLNKEAISLSRDDIDILEWRVDKFNRATERKTVLTALESLGKIIANKPLIFTIRTEGEKYVIRNTDYFKLCNLALDSEKVDILDLEFSKNGKEIKQIIKKAKDKNVQVLISHHDFDETPSKHEILKKFIDMQNLNADIIKIAVMPQNPRDVLTLLDASLTMKEEYAKVPFISISMSNMGAISRISGELFGSSISFGCLKNTSAPGQINVEYMKNFFINIL